MHPVSPRHPLKKVKSMPWQVYSPFQGCEAQWGAEHPTVPHTPVPHSIEKRYSSKLKRSRLKQEHYWLERERSLFELESCRLAGKRSRLKQEHCWLERERSPFELENFRLAGKRSRLKQEHCWLERERSPFELENCRVAGKRSSNCLTALTKYSDARVRHPSTVYRCGQQSVHLVLSRRELPLCRLPVPPVVPIAPVPSPAPLFQ